MYNVKIRTPYPNELYHHGIKGQKWGVRRYQNPDGSLTAAGKKRYGKNKSAEQQINDLKKLGFEDNGTHGNTTFLKRTVKTDVGPVKLHVNVNHDGSNPPDMDVVKDFVSGKQKMKEIDSNARKVCEESANRMYGMSVGKLMSIDVMSDGNCLINYEGNPTKPNSGFGSYGIFYTEFDPRTKKVGTYASYDD